MADGVVLQTSATMAGREVEDIASRNSLNALDRRLIQPSTKEAELLQRMREQVAELDPESKASLRFSKLGEPLCLFMRSRN